MFNRTSVLMACGAILSLAVAGVFAGAPPTANRTMYLTFSGPVALPGVILTTGTYIFELADPNISPDVVRIRTGDRTRLVYMGFTRRVERPEGLPATRRVSLGETRAGVPPPITAWYPEDESFGHQFIYESHDH